MGCASGGDGMPPVVDAMTVPRDGGIDGAVAPVDGGRSCTADGECDDGDACNGVERCSGGTCGLGTPVSCDDMVACTVDTCAPADGTCTHTADDTRCGTGLVCDPVDDCSAPRPCTVDADCDDSMLCNGPETCDPAFGCRRGAAPACDDAFACTTDSCDATANACVHTNDDAPCDDGLACDGAEACDPSNPVADGMGCVASTPPVCDDGVACTTDLCSETAGGCTTMPMDSACDDGVFCNGPELCTATGCGPGTAPACDDGIGCTMGSCDAATDRCVQTGDDAFCADGMACNGTERCDITGTTTGRGCVAGAPIDCSDGLPCTTDSCTEPGTCVHGGSDADGDGYTAVGCAGGNDCDDLTPSVHPGAAEICDGIDNDCSGGVDDGAMMQCALGSAPRACTTTCSSPGLQACNATCRLSACIGTAELCNDCDDDSDGLIDDGLLCRRGTSMTCTTSCGTSGSRTCASDCSSYGACAAATETCNDCDDNGNGLVDDGLPCRRSTSSSCTTSCGTTGSRVCAVDCSGYGACRAAAETCNGCDDDGDGATDEDFACRQASTMGCSTVCGTAGTRTCNATCSGYGTCSATEVCNGCDDDADGTVDDGFTCAAGASRACTTPCGGPGTQTCNASCGGWSACTAPEICNACDDDGVSGADNGFTCVQASSRGCTTGCGTGGTQSCNATCSGYGACSATEVCNGCDDDGVSGADNGFTCVQGASSGCTTGCGTAGNRTCNATCSGYGACSATEVCNGCDDDGVGGADNGFTCVQGAASGCLTACGSAGSRTCNASCSGYGACNGAEVCNGCDDDGVGGPDNGLTCVQGAVSACTTACGTAGSHTCNGTCTGFSTCFAATETCGNGCDDNGVGGIDEGCGPANDLCGGAIALSMAGTGTTVTGTTVGTTNQSACGSGGDVYYSFTLTQREMVYLDTETRSYDTEVALATACAGNIACSDDSTCFGLGSQYAQMLDPGTYYAVVSGFGGQTGTFTLRFQHLPTGTGVPVALTHPATGAVVSGTTAGASGITATCGSSTGPETMYYFMACPGGGAFSASTCSAATWDTQLYFRDASSGVETCNDDACGLQSTVSGTSSAGAGLRALYIDGFGGGSGAYTITYTMP